MPITLERQTAKFYKLKGSFLSPVPPNNVKIGGNQSRNIVVLYLRKIALNVTVQVP